MAAGYAAVGIGEDTGGSVRGPAAANNVVGLRPTVALVSRALQPDSWPRLPNFLYAAFQAVDTNIPLWQMPRLVFALLRAPFFGIDSQAISREMVVPFQTSEGAQVLAPNWDAINPVLEHMFGG